jgi:hypothetical protein
MHNIHQKNIPRQLEQQSYRLRHTSSRPLKRNILLSNTNSPNKRGSRRNNNTLSKLEATWNNNPSSNLSNPTLTKITNLNHCPHRQRQAGLNLFLQMH